MTTIQRDEMRRWATRRVAERYPDHAIDLESPQTWQLMFDELAECCVPGVTLELVKQS